MNSQEFYEKIDSLYETQPTLVESFLLELLDQSTEIGLIVLIHNELIGYYRSHSCHQDAIEQSFAVLKLLGQLDLMQDIQGATTMLNCATAFKAADCFEEAKLLYERCFKIYEANLTRDDIRFASLYNNMSDLYQRKNETIEAIHYIQKALNIINKEEHSIEWATSQTNLGGLYLAINNPNAIKVLKAAQVIFTKYEDPHYGVCLLYLAKIEESIETYEHALTIIKKYFGENDDFKEGYKEYVALLIKQEDQIRLPLAKKYLAGKTITGIELAEAYYQAYGKPMLEKKFPRIFKEMSIGLIGKGSECYGLDEALSQDHDFYPRFTLIVIDGLSDATIKEIQLAYDCLFPYFLCFTKVLSNTQDKRDGVFRVSDFFKQLLGSHYPLKEPLDWFYIDENNLSMSQNGKLFKNDNDLFINYRLKLTYYPRDVQLKKIMSRLAKMAQAGQYNYTRMMKRKDVLTANQYQSVFVTETLHLLFLLNKQYCPYVKWQLTLASKLETNQVILTLLKKLITLPFNEDIYEQADIGVINKDDKKAECIEKICSEVVTILNELGLTNHSDSFLQNHLENIREHIIDAHIKEMHVMEE